MELEGSAVAIGIDAAVVADHHVMVRRRDARGPGTVLEEFRVAPTLVGMERLSKKLSVYPGALAVAEPTSMTWLPLALTLKQAGCSFASWATAMQVGCGARSCRRLGAGAGACSALDVELLSKESADASLRTTRKPLCVALVAEDPAGQHDRVPQRRATVCSQRVTPASSAAASEVKPTTPQGWSLKATRANSRAAAFTCSMAPPPRIEPDVSRVSMTAAGMVVVSSGISSNPVINRPFSRR